MKGLENLMKFLGKSSEDVSVNVGAISFLQPSLILGVSAIAGLTYGVSQLVSYLVGN